MTEGNDTRFGRGQALTRIEDYRLLTGRGRYTDDMVHEDALHCVFLRSDFAHARIICVETKQALARRGVLAVITGRDLAAAAVGPIPTAPGFKRADGSPATYPPRRALALDRVRFVGEAVAAIIARSRPDALDAAEALAVEYEELPAVTDPAKATIVATARHGDAAATQAAFDAAAHVVSLEIEHQRLVPSAIEPRATVASYDPVADRITLHTGIQTPGRTRDALARAVLKIDPARLRILVGDIGGGFGMKVAIYPEDVVLAHAARTLQRTVRWRAERAEEFLAGNHARAMRSKLSLALDADGRFLALRAHSLANLGGYATGGGVLVQSDLGPKVATGVYDIPAIDLRIDSVLTNTTPVGPYRGAGRPENIFNIERLVDAAACDMGVDPVTLRKRNLIPAQRMPYRNAMAQTYDSGDFRNVLDQALRLADWDGFAARKRDSERRGQLRGRGVSTFLEWTGGYELTEKVRVRVNPDGRIRIWSATQAMGQGLETSYTQLAAQQFGLDMAAIEIVQGDTDVVSGVGSFGSRSLFVGGSAVQAGAAKTIAAGLERASSSLEASARDIAYRNGVYSIAGTDRRISIFELADREPQRALVLDTDFTVAGESWPNGCHVCEVEIDKESGAVRIDRFTSVDDVGNPINPLIVAGQIHGGIAQGVGQALMEQAHYDPDSGQLVTGSFADYCLPRADDMPDLSGDLDTSQPCRNNPLGAKGCGESGTVGSVPAIVSAVVDALRPYGIRHLDMPITAQRVWRIIFKEEK